MLAILFRSFCILTSKNYEIIYLPIFWRFYIWTWNIKKERTFEQYNMNFPKKADFDIWDDGDNNDFSCYYYWRRYEPLFDCLVKISEWGCTYIFYYYLKNSMLTSANIQWLHEYCNKIMVIMFCSFDLWYLSPVHIIIC